MDSFKMFAAAIALHFTSMSKAGMPPPCSSRGVWRPRTPRNPSLKDGETMTYDRLHGRCLHLRMEGAQ